MKVLIVDGSDCKTGSGHPECMQIALQVITEVLKAEGMDTERFRVNGEGSWTEGDSAREAAEHKAWPCNFSDRAKEFLRKAETADGFLFGAPLEYGSVGSSMLTFLNQVFFMDVCAGNPAFYLKPAAVVIFAEREEEGVMRAYEQLYSFLIRSGMPVVSSDYWNVVYGATPEAVQADIAGIRTLHMLGDNMACLLQCIGAGKRAGVRFPKRRLAGNQELAGAKKIC